MDQIVHEVLRFDRFVLDFARGCLRAGDQEIDLRSKTFEVLCYLAENAGRLVLKRETRAQRCECGGHQSTAFRGAKIMMLRL
jgi:DNA-binding response OmpR family regulator